jgi:uncharacterized phage-associated protein
MRYREDKATQAAARLLSHAGGHLNVLKLMKLLYLAERRGIVEFGRPIAFDYYCSMPHGPVMSFTYDRIQAAEKDSYWRKHITERDGYDVSLRGVRIPCDQLSPAEEGLIDDIWKKYGKMSQFQLRDFTHTLPEWRDPQGSSTPIQIEDILRAEGYSNEDVADVLGGLRAEEFAAQLVG